MKQTCILEGACFLLGVCFFWSYMNKHVTVPWIWDSTSLLACTTTWAFSSLQLEYILLLSCSGHSSYSISSICIPLFTQQSMTGSIAALQTALDALSLCSNSRIWRKPARLKPGQELKTYPTPPHKILRKSGCVKVELSNRYFLPQNNHRGL